MASKVVKRGRGRPALSGAEQGRETLLQAARELLRETPPNLVTRRMVAERAGADPGLLRYYFGTVENLIAEVAQAAITEMRERVDVAGLVEHPEKAFRARMTAILDMFLENPYQHEIVRHYQIGDQNERSKDMWLSGLAASLGQLRTILDNGAALGELRSVDERFLHMVMIGSALFFSASDLFLKDMFGADNGRVELRDSFAEFLEDLLLKGLEPRQAAAALPDPSPAGAEVIELRSRRPD